MGTPFTGKTLVDNIISFLRFVILEENRKNYFESHFGKQEKETFGWTTFSSSAFGYSWPNHTQLEQLC